MGQSRSGSSNPMDAVTVLIAALAASAIGALFYNLLPVYLGSAQDYRGLDNRAIGFISSAFFFGYNVVTVSAFFWIRRVSWRVVIAVSIPVAIGALLAGTAADAYALLLLTIAIAGGAFAAIYGVGTTILGDTSNPARWYGVKIAIEALVGAVLLLVLPTMVIAKWGFAGANFGLIVATVVLTPFLVWLPARGVKGSREEQGPAEASPPQSPLIWAALFATFLFFSAASAVWAFLERIGANGGHSPAAVGILLSITLVAAVLGSLAAAALGGRFLTARLFIAGGALFVVALVFLNAPLDFTNYAIGACIVTFAIGYMLPIAVTEVAELDSDGRYIVLSVPAIGLGAMAGPAVAGILTQDNAYTPLLAVAAMAILISGILMGIASGRARATR